ncbi:MAG TPA: TCP-1/cpn60 chaperonin family protein [Bacilli bacterium]
MSQVNLSNQDREERYSTLLNNAGAIRAICSAVESTLGPKGLDTMLVGAQGEVIITNDGVTILEKMDVTHPAARLLVQVARSQQSRVGDGTTTATVLAGALVSEGVAQVIRGVPVSKVVHGMQLGVKRVVEDLLSRSRVIQGLDDPLLHRVALIAGREYEDIAELVLDGAKCLGIEKLQDVKFSFADAVTAHEKAENEVFPGLLIGKKPLNSTLEVPLHPFSILVLQDALEPEALDEEALSTETGFQKFMELRQQYLIQIEKLALLNIKLLVVGSGVDKEAEQYCSDLGIMVLQRVSYVDMQRICEHTAAKPVKRIALKKSNEELSAYLGRAEQLSYDEHLEKVRLSGGSGKAVITILVGASTSEVVGERARIAKDAAASLQAAVRGGYLPGGGAAEIAAAYELDRYRETIKGMEGFGVSAVSEALSKPLAQIVINAGFNPLEKVEEVKTAQLTGRSDSIGINCDTGALIDCLEQGIADPTLVKVHALKAAGEVAAAILRIHTVIKMKQFNEIE